MQCISGLPGLQRLSSMLPCHTDARHPETLGEQDACWSNAYGVPGPQLPSYGFKSLSQPVTTAMITRGRNSATRLHSHEHLLQQWAQRRLPMQRQTYPSWGTRTRALGRSSTEELMIVSRKSPSGLATWWNKGGFGGRWSGIWAPRKTHLEKDLHWALPIVTPCTPPLCPAYRHTMYTPSVPCLWAHHVHPLCALPTDISCTYLCALQKGTPCTTPLFPAYGHTVYTHSVPCLWAHPAHTSVPYLQIYSAHPSVPRLQAHPK